MKAKRISKVSRKGYSLTFGYIPPYPRFRGTRVFRNFVQNALDRMWDEIVDRYGDIEVADIAMRGARDALSGPIKRCRQGSCPYERIKAWENELRIGAPKDVFILLGSGALKEFSRGKLRPFHEGKRKGKRLKPLISKSKCYSTKWAQDGEETIVEKSRSTTPVRGPLRPTKMSGSNVLLTKEEAIPGRLRKRSKVKKIRRRLGI